MYIFMYVCNIYIFIYIYIYIYMFAAAAFFFEVQEADLCTTLFSGRQTNRFAFFADHRTRRFSLKLERKPSSTSLQSTNVRDRICGE